MALVGWALLAASAGVHADNLLSNGNMEQTDGKGGAAGWALYAPVAEGQKRGLAAVKPGYKSAQAVALTETETPGILGMYSRPVRVEALPGEEVLFTCYYKTQGDPHAHLTLVGYADSFIEKEWRTPYLQTETQALPAAPDWSLVCWRFRFVPGVKDLVVIFRLTTEGKLFVDEAALRPYPTEVSLRVQSAGVVEALPKQRLVEVDLTSTTGKDRDLQVQALALGEKGALARAGTSVRLTGPKPQTVRLKYDCDYRQAHVLRLTVQDKDGTTVYDQLDAPVPGLVSARLVSPAFRQSLLSKLPTPTLAVTGALNVVPALRDRLTLSAEVVGVPGGSFTLCPAGRDSSLYRFEVPTPAMLSGDHVVRVTARLPQGTQQIDLPLRRAPAGLPEVGYDEQRRLWVHGRRMFPLGLYGMQSADDIPIAAAAGFNFVVSSSARASYEMRAAAVQANLGVVVSGASTEGSFWDHLQNKWGTSPACLGWIPYSRSDLRGYSPLAVATLYDALTRTSPSVPVLQPLASPSLARYYADAADILVAWSLPVPHSPLRALGDMVEVLREAVGEHKPVWAIIQAQGGGAFRDNPYGPAAVGRGPTPGEMEALAYLALVRGADGLMWYSYSPADDAAGPPLPQTDPALWAAMTALNVRLRWLTPVLLDGTRETLPAAAGGAVEMARWRYEDADYLLAVNTGDKGLVSPIPLGAPRLQAQVLFEERGVEADADGDILDSFPPFGVHLYVIEKG